MNLRNVLTWTILGALFGIFFGVVASIFQGGPDIVIGIKETWWWFATAGFLMSTIGASRKSESPH